MTQKVSSYRKDGRTTAQFAKAIEEGSIFENVLVRVYAQKLSNITGDTYSVISTGCGPDGQLLSEKAVSTRCDFTLVNQKGQLFKIDIKYSKPDLPTFHLKEAHLNSYIKQDTSIIMFMGINSDQIRYTTITPKEQEILLKNGKRVRLWGKEQIRCKTADFSWQSV